MLHCIYWFRWAASYFEWWFPEFVLHAIVITIIISIVIIIIIIIIIITIVSIISSVVISSLISTIIIAHTIVIIIMVSSSVISRAPPVVQTQTHRELQARFASAVRASARFLF